jgi:deferrochelatase/peroxidase EfeB
VSAPDQDKKHPSRRDFFAAAGSLAVAGAALGPGATVAGAAPADIGHASEPFRGAHQGGIVTPPQSHSYFLALDLRDAAKRDDVAALLKLWTDAAQNLAAGQPVATATQDNYGESDVTPDSGEALGLSPARLTVTFGFGAGLFVKDGKDRFGLASRRPEAFIDLPRFTGDQLVEAQTGGDLSIQACADDPQVAFHAVRQLARLGATTAQVRWAQAGFLPKPAPKDTPRNLMGFKDGTGNPSIADAAATSRFVWVGDEGPDWMRGGSYVVVRRIRMALEHWDRMKLAFQEQTIGRHKISGAPIGKQHELDAVDLASADKDGNPVIAENAHIRLAAAASNDGAKILRRPYSYNDGMNFTAERWPPWRQGMEYDAGLFFLCYQRDPRTGFVKIYDKMAKLDMMNQFVTHTGGGLFACPGGIAAGEFVGQRLFAA